MSVSYQSTPIRNTISSVATDVDRSRAKFVELEKVQEGIARFNNLAFTYYS